jgi:hypothetical protein
MAKQPQGQNIPAREYTDFGCRPSLNESRPFGLWRKLNNAFHNSPKIEHLFHFSWFFRLFVIKSGKFFTARKKRVFSTLQCHAFWWFFGAKSEPI